MNPVEQLRADWEDLHERLREPKNNFHPACDHCTLDACCYEPVFSDYGEVDDILSRLSPEALEKLKFDILVWREGARNYFHLPQEGIAFPYRTGEVACPFLKGGRCSIYEHRPLACRSHYALSNPEGCKMPARAEQKYACFEQCVPYQKIALKYVFAMRSLQTDHFGLLIYNRLYGKTEESKAAHGYELEETATV